MLHRRDVVFTILVRIQLDSIAPGGVGVLESGAFDGASSDWGVELETVVWLEHLVVMRGDAAANVVWPGGKAGGVGINRQREPQEGLNFLKHDLRFLRFLRCLITTSKTASTSRAGYTLTEFPKSPIVIISGTSVGSPGGSNDDFMLCI